MKNNLIKKKPIYWIRIVALAFWFYLNAFYLLIRSLLRWGDYDVLWKGNQFFSFNALKILNLKFDIKGSENLIRDEGCVIISNHQSALDIIIIGIVLDRSYIVIGKKEIMYIPFFGLMMMATGSALIDRGHRTKAIKGLRDALAKIKRHKLGLIIYPEGTRNRKRLPLLKFKKGAFHAAKEGQLPISIFVTGSLSNVTDRDWATFGDEVVPLHILPQVSVETVNQLSVDELSDHCRQIMTAELEKMAAFKKNSNSNTVAFADGQSGANK